MREHQRMLFPLNYRANIRDRLFNRAVDARGTGTEDRGCDQAKQNVTCHDSPAPLFLPDWSMNVAGPQAVPLKLLEPVSAKMSPLTCHASVDPLGNRSRCAFSPTMRPPRTPRHST